MISLNAYKPHPMPSPKEADIFPIDPPSASGIFSIVTAVGRCTNVIAPSAFLDNMTVVVPDPSLSQAYRFLPLAGSSLSALILRACLPSRDLYAVHEFIALVPRSMAASCLVPRRHNITILHTRLDRTKLHAWVNSAPRAITPVFVLRDVSAKHRQPSLHWLS